MDILNELLKDENISDRFKKAYKPDKNLDYDKMRCALACYEAEQMDRSELYDVLLFGYKGYKNESDDEIVRMFISIWSVEQIPFI